MDTLISEYKGTSFNSPNDVVIKSDETIWFTDPKYREYIYNTKPLLPQTN